MENRIEVVVAAAKGSLAGLPGSVDIRVSHMGCNIPSISG
jgi:hypothetical protein